MKEELCDGKVEIVIGMYVFLVKIVKFNDLGLLIVDEEQNFGVKYKEMFKVLCVDVYVFILIVILILCILQLVLIGIWDLFIIVMFLVDCFVVRIYVILFDVVIVCEVLLCEKYCGGQVFFVVLCIFDFDDIVVFFCESVLEVFFVIVYGQMVAG